jgi:cardiolipin synthase C
MGGVGATVRYFFPGFVLLLTSCTAVPFDYPKEITYAQPVAENSFTARSTRPVLAGRGNQSAFYPIVSGNDALGARLRMVDNAEEHIDIQYFLIKPDHAGALFASALLRAADRGVKIRFLIDDIFTTATDDQLAYLDSHPNIELRIFNPFSRNAPQALSFLTSFSRVNRRMHNKFISVDGAFGIMGGRNIADEYYQIGTEVEFADFDIGFTGPVVQQLARTFDLFWNDARAVPLEAFHEHYNTVNLTQVATDIRDKAEEGGQHIYSGAVGSDYLRDVREGRIKPFYANASVVTDLPEKLRQPKNSGYNTLYTEIQKRMLAAKEEVIILTPYFVPRRSGVDFYKQLRAKGIRVVIVTNSLAATNHAYVHGGYAPYRKELLEAGVQLYEVRADAPELVDPSLEGIRLTMHTKLAVIDRETLFVGSLNFDPRSIEINTELGLFIESPEAAYATARSISNRIKEYTYAVRLDQNGNIAWVYDGSLPRQIETDEPGASGSAKFIAGVTSILPVEGQL